MIHETASSGNVVITVAKSPTRNTVTPRAVLSVEDDVNKRPVSKFTDLPASNPTTTEPTIPTMSNTANAVRNVDARDRIRVIGAFDVFMADTL
jgi:hypothetical protein